MAQQDLPKDVLAFLTDHIGSVVELEALLLLHGTPGRAWKASEIAKELRIDPAWNGAQLLPLCASGVLTQAGNPDPTFTYDPKQPATRSTIDALARIYPDRRVTVIGLIFNKPADNLKTFADAFRIRKDPQS